MNPMHEAMRRLAQSPMGQQFSQGQGFGYDPPRHYAQRPWMPAPIGDPPQTDQMQPAPVKQPPVVAHPPATMPPPHGPHAPQSPMVKKKKPVQLPAAFTGLHL